MITARSKPGCGYGAPGGGAHGIASCAGDSSRSSSAGVNELHCAQIVRTSPRRGFDSLRRRPHTVHVNVTYAVTAPPPGGQRSRPYAPPHGRGGPAGVTTAGCRTTQQSKSGTAWQSAAVGHPPDEPDRTPHTTPSQLPPEVRQAATETDRPRQESQREGEALDHAGRTETASTAAARAISPTMITGAPLSLRCEACSRRPRYNAGGRWAASQRQ